MEQSPTVPETSMKDLCLNPKLYYVGSAWITAYALFLRSEVASVQLAMSGNLLRFFVKACLTKVFHPPINQQINLSSHANLLSPKRLLFL